MASQPKTRYTPDEYIALEDKIQLKSVPCSPRLSDIYNKIDFSSS